MWLVVLSKSSDAMNYVLKFWASHCVIIAEKMFWYFTRVLFQVVPATV